MEGIRRYLAKYAYGNTQTKDLWASLSDASGKDVEKIMDIWTKNVGFPVVHVTEDPSSQSIKVKQNRFLRTADVTPEEDKTLYPVFLELRTKDGINKDLVLSKREESFDVKDLDFFKLNADHSGIYRTSYTAERMEKLGNAARKGLLSTEDRAGMIADAGALAATGYQKTSALFSLLQSFNSESEFVVWDEILSRLSAVRSAWIFEDQTSKDALKAFQRDLSSGKAHKLGWTFKDSDGHIEQQFKSLLFGSAALSGDDATQKAAFDMFAKLKSGDPSAIHPNLRSAVYAIVLQEGGEEEYDAVINEYRTGKTSDERNTALRALGRATKPELIRRTLSLPLNGDEVKAQDIYLPISGMRLHEAGITALWNWLTQNWEPLQKILPPGLTMLSSVVTICTSALTKKEQWDEVEAFFKDKSTKGFDRALAQSSDSVRAKDMWRTRDAEDVRAWLTERGYLS